VLFKTKTGMEIQQLPSREVVEQLRGFVYQSSWTHGELTTAYNAYKGLGHKYPKSMGCPSCMVDIIKFWRDYLKQHGNG
jgi:hypothetical protein